MEPAPFTLPLSATTVMVSEASVLFKSQTDCVLAWGSVIVVVPVTFTLQSKEASV
jgi:hypothetical protein